MLNFHLWKWGTTIANRKRQPARTPTAYRGQWEFTVMFTYPYKCRSGLLSLHFLSRLRTWRMWESNISVCCKKLDDICCSQTNNFSLFFLFAGHCGVEQVERSEHHDWEKVQLEDLRTLANPHATHPRHMTQAHILRESLIMPSLPPPTGANTQLILIAQGINMMPTHQHSTHSTLPVQMTGSNKAGWPSILVSLNVSC